VENRRVRRVPLLFAAALVVALSVVASGCGGGKKASGTPPDKYAAGVCGAIVSWQQRLTQSGTKLGQELGGSSDPAVIKQKLSAFLADAVASTNKMISDVKAVGAPAVDKGDQLQSDLVNGLTRAKTALADAKAKVDKLPSNDRTAFITQTQQLGTTLQAQGRDIESAFNSLDTKYHSKALNEAFSKNSACQKL
jgi:hypothetical protein